MILWWLSVFYDQQYLKISTWYTWWYCFNFDLRIVCKEYVVLLVLLGPNHLCVQQIREYAPCTDEFIICPSINSLLILDNEESAAVGSTEDIDYTPMPPESALFIFSSTNMWVWKKKDRVSGA